MEFMLGYHNSLGASLDNTICVKDPSVLPQHAIIEYKNDRFVIHRGSAKAKVLVNGVPIEQETDLTHGDVVQLGNVMIIFSEESPTTPSDVLKQVTPAPTKPSSTTVQARIKHFEDSKEVINTFKKNEQLQARLETLYHVSSIISGTLDLNSLVNKLFNVLFEVFDPDRVFLLLYDDLGKLKVVAQRLSEKCQLKGFVNVSRSIIKEVIDAREAMLIRSALTDERFSLKQSVIEQNIQSAMCAPLVKNDKIMGALYVDRLTKIKNYQEEDLNLLNAIASQVAVAQDNARLYDRSMDFTRKLTKLSEASRELSTHLDRDHIIRRAVESATKVFECTRCSILLYNEREGVLEMAYSNSIERTLWPTIRVKPGEGFTGKVFADNAPLLVMDADSVPGTGKRDYSSSSFLIVPIVARQQEMKTENRPIGVMAITDKVSRRPFDSGDQELLSIFAAHLGTCLNNAALFERATIDNLTRVYNRQFFFVKLDEELRAVRGNGRTLSLAMLDLDHFKSCNDTYGQHQVGDRVLQDFARIVNEIVSQHGFVGRYGGDEFIACFPNLRSEEALVACETLRRRIEGYQLQTPRGPVRVSVSVGVAHLESDESADVLVRKADSALYAAKRNGRNRVEIYHPQMEAPPPDAHRAR